MQLAEVMTSGQVRQFRDAVPVLADGVVRLRAAALGDVPGMVEQCRDPQMVTFTTVPSPYETVHAHQWIDQLAGAWQDEQGQRGWSIEADDDEGFARFCGSIDYRPSGHGVAEVGFGLHPAARGRGLMSRALRLVLAYAFEHGIHTMQWRAVVGNWGSLRTAWACGFTLEGTVRGLLANPRGSADGWIATIRAGEPTTPRTRWLEPTVLEGHGVRLRPWRDEDVPEPDDPSAARYLGSSGPPADRAGYARWLTGRQVRMALGESVHWCIADPGLDPGRDPGSDPADRPVGRIQLFRMDHAASAGNAMLGFTLLPAARGQGVLARTLDLLVPHAFAPRERGGLGLSRLAAEVELDNRSSQRALRRAGFSQCGQLHELMGSREPAARADPPEREDLLVFELLAGTDRDAARVEPLAVPAIVTDRLRLRAWGPDDDRDESPDALAEEHLPPHAMPRPGGYPAWLGRQQRGGDVADSICWCIADPDSDRALGCVVLFRLTPTREPYQAEIGYWLYPHGRGHRYAGEAVDAVLAYAVGSREQGGLGLSRVFAEANASNLASRRVLTGAGLAHWGTDHATLWSPLRPPGDGAYFELLTDHPVARRDELVVVPLAGQRVRLRRWDEQDLPWLAQALADPGVAELLGGAPGDRAPDPARWLADGREAALAGRELRWCVADLAQDRPIGGIDVRDVRRRFYSSTAEIECWLGPQERGHGIGQEALDLALGHLLCPAPDGGLGLERVTARCDELNLAAQVGLRRAGFSFECLQPGAHLRADATAGAAVVYAVTAGQDRVALAARAEVRALTPATLADEVVGLRAWQESDADRLAQACSDEQTQYWLADLPRPYGRVDALAYLAFVGRAHQSGAGVYWCVADPQDGRALGAVAVMGLAEGDTGSGEIGYWAHPQARGRGVLTHAVALVVRHAFILTPDGGLGLHRLTLNAAAGNAASLRVAEQTGFLRTGVDRAAERLGDGTFVDLVRHDQLAQDWLVRQRR